VENFVNIRDAYFKSDSQILPPMLAKTPPKLCAHSDPDIKHKAKLQQKYFKALDLGSLEPPAADHIFKDPSMSASTKQWEVYFKRAFVQLKSNPALHAPSHTLVMEVAFFLLEAGVLTAPQTGRINVKQARALLHIAAWLQILMSRKWIADGLLSADTLCGKKHLRRFGQMMLAIMGPAGTGKTSIIKVAEALIEYFVGDDVVVKCAPSNTAARLFKGDTVHSWWKLLGDRCAGKRNLKKPALDKLRRRWTGKVIQFIDEISMLAPQQLAHGDLRTKAATRKFDEVMGGIASVATGDMLQLPPVNRPSLAEPLDIHGKRRRRTQEEAVDGDAAKQDEQAIADHRTGLGIWHKFQSVVMLTLNVRAPGPLGDLLAELRAGPLSDASMELLRSRLIGYSLVAGKARALPMGTPDPRLTQPPFSNNAIHFVVARHKLRACQSFQNAMMAARSLGVPVFVVMSLDAPKVDEAHLFTERVRNQLLDNVTLREIHHMPGILPLYVGMGLLLSSKDCVHLGLMNGCEVVLEEIMFAPVEDLPDALVAGSVHELKYLPSALLLRAVGVQWTLPAEQLPELVAATDAKGLFCLSPSQVSIRATAKDDQAINVRRTGFQLLPADTRTAHASQGETWVAVIGDLARPPRMDISPPYWNLIDEVRE
jgi:hypothetical protein